MSMLHQPLSKSLLFSVVVMLGLSFLVMSNGLRAWNDVGRIVDRSELIAAIGHFVHELQIERGLSALFLGSPGDETLPSLVAQRAITDVKVRSFKQATSSVMASGDVNFAPAQGVTGTILQKFDGVREGITSRDVPDDESFVYYSVLIKQMLDLQQELSKNVVNRELRDNIQVLRILSWTKERTGQIRALGSEGFASGNLTPGNYNLLIQLIGVQNDRQLELNSLLTPSQREHLERLADHSEATALEQLQGFLLDDGLDGRLRVSDAQPWFRAITVHINRFKDVEDEFANQVVQRSLALKREITLKFLSMFTILVAVLSVTIASLWRGQNMAVHQRKNLQESLSAEQERSKQILETMTGAICVVGQNGFIEYANPAMLAAFGNKDFNGKADEILPCAGSKECALTPEGLTWKEGKCGQEKISPITGRGYGIHCTPLKNYGDKQSRLVVMTDVTDHLMTEERLLEAKNLAESASHTKSSILANMSHELRTPLNAIIGFSDIMVHDVFGALGNDRYSEYANDIHASGLHLLDLVNDILDVSAIEVGKVELQNENVDIGSIVESAVRLIHSRAFQGKVTLNVHLDGDLPLFYGDQRRLKQILLNLLSNAVKFTPEKGAVTVSTKTDETGAILIIIEDTGAGMSKKELSISMEPFGQADSGLNRKHEGTGLGLPLTKGLIELHNGVMDIQSHKGKGTTVSVKFPSERSIPRTMTPQSKGTHANKQCLGAQNS